MQKINSVVLIFIVISLAKCSVSADGDMKGPFDDTAIVSLITNDGTTNPLPVHDDTLRIPVKVDIEPVWADMTDSMHIPIPDRREQDFYLLWDRSVPIGGYIHNSVQDSMNALQEISDKLMSEISVSAYGDTIPKCREITDITEDIACRGQLSSRSFFQRTESPIDEGIQFMIDNLKSGSIKGAALISDLMTTADHICGPMALLPLFKDIKSYFDEGEIHVAIIGVRTKYWGVQRGQCPLKDGDLGCWFQECQTPGRYLALTKPVDRPLYVLIMGRSTSEEDNRKDNPVAMIATGLRETLDRLGFDVKSEIITLGALSPQAEGFDWILPPDGPHQPIDCDSNQEGCTCRNERTYTLTGEFKRRGISIDETPIDMTDGPKIFTQPIIRDGGKNLETEIDCRRVREFQRCTGEDRNYCANGILESQSSRMTMKLNYVGSDYWNYWDEWSSLREGSHSTIDLAGFIDELRPIRYEATISPILPLACCKR